MNQTRNFALALARLGALLIGTSSTCLHAAAFSDDNWTSMSGYPGVKGPVLTAAADASGNLYIGGSFTIVADVFATNIAKWDGAHWSALGSGLHTDRPWLRGAYALAVSGNDVYAAGNFTNAGGVAANNIAKWDGTGWSALGAGMDNTVWALAVSGNDLYVSGDFTNAGGIAASRIAKWNGSNWSALGSGLNERARALAVSGNYLYVGGRFTNAGGIMVNQIASWDGTRWSALGSGVEGFDYLGKPNAAVSALAVSGRDLYVAGQFSIAGGSAATNMAKWDGSTWWAFPSPISSVNEPTLSGSVNALAISGNDLYAAGDIQFDLGGGASTFGTYLMKWDGTGWSALEPGISWAWDPYDEPHVHAVAVSGTNVYAGGEFRSAGGVSAHCIAKWNGAQWSALAPTFRYLTAVTASGPDVYGAGVFTTADGAQAKYVARWNTTNWSALGSAFQSDNSSRAVVSALAVSGGDLYAGGGFTNAGGTAANQIARWNGTHWSALGSGLGGSSNSIPAVYALAVSGNDLYVGGRFTNAGGIAAINIARWNGTNWSALGSGIGPWLYLGSAWVSALAVSETNLYAGGIFTAAGGRPANCIAKWDGSSWSALGSGMGGSGSAPAYVTALAVLGNDLYAGGWFTTAGGITVRCVAKWNGSSWSALCSGMTAAYWSDDGEYNTTPYVYALAVSGSDLYVGGYFNTAGDADANFIAKWDGNSWSALGSGMDSGVGLLAATGDELFAAGGFTKAGGKISPYVARARIGSIAKSLLRTQSTASIEFSGVTGYPYDVERATSLAPQIAWTTVTPGPLYPASDGSFTFADTNANWDTAFYRASFRSDPLIRARIGVQQPAGTDLTNGVSRVDYGAVALGSSSAAKTFTITNSGMAGLAIDDVSANSVDFALDMTGMLWSVPAGGSTTFTVTFTPAAAGSRTGALFIFSYDMVDRCGATNDEQFVLTLSGTGL